MFRFSYWAFVIVLSVSLTSFANDEVKKGFNMDAFAMLPVVRRVAVSPDGKKLAIVRATSKNGDYIIEVRDAFNLKKRPVTFGASRMLVSQVVWLNNKKIGVMFRQILKDGAHKFWVSKFAIVNANGKGNWLVPFRNKKFASFNLIDRLPNNPNEVLLETDINNNYIPDVVRFNINTGKSVTVTRGNTKISGNFITDDDGDVRAATGWNRKDQTLDLYARLKGSDDWQLIHQISPKNRENFDFLAFSKSDPNKAYVKANLGEDKAGIYLYDLKTKTTSERIFGVKHVDADSIMKDSKGNLLGFTYTSKWPVRYFTDANEQALYDSITPLFKDKFVSIVSRADDDSVLVIKTQSDHDPGSYYIITNKKQLHKIGETYPLIDKNSLADVKYVSYRARDGRKIKAYVTIPNGKGPFPAIVLPHGGPWVRDTIIFDEWSQMLAANGYIVIQPNYRGSTGYGLEHWTIADKNWGLTMQDDLDDAAMFLVNKGLAKKDKLALFGWSYGGYAGFVASMRKNNIYQCSVAGAGVSNLNRWNAILNDNPFLRRLQRPTIKGVSPIEHVEDVNVPILVIHGSIDSRVPIKHSREFVDELEKHHKDFKYVELEDADHFYDTLFYEHKKQLYSELLNWFDNKCHLKQ